MGGKGRVQTHTSVSMGILSTPISTSEECIEISSLLSWFPQEIILAKPLMADRSRLVSRLLLHTSLIRARLLEISSSERRFRPQINSSRRRLLETSRVVSSQLVHSRYLRALFADKSMPERGFRVMIRESRLIKASIPARSEIPEGGINRASVASAYW